MALSTNDVFDMMTDVQQEEVQICEDTFYPAGHYTDICISKVIPQMPMLVYDSGFAYHVIQNGIMK